MNIQIYIKPRNRFNGGLFRPIREEDTVYGFRSEQNRQNSCAGMLGSTID